MPRRYDALEARADGQAASGRRTTSMLQRATRESEVRAAIRWFARFSPTRRRTANFRIARDPGAIHALTLPRDKIVLHPMPLTSGTRLGPYEILAPIGAGGMREVYQAKDTRLGRIVALKFSKSEFSERFEREARAVAALNHSNICQLY